MTARAFSRVGLLGNPGDALGGPAITLAYENLWAEVTVTESERIRIEEPLEDQPEWDSLEDLFQHIHRRGHHGGRRLMMALIRRLAKHRMVQTIPWPPPNFTLTWTTTIPLCVGLAGSSALLTAAARAICQFWNIEIPPSELVSLILKTEAKDLGIPAGPQDRVAHVYQGLQRLRIAHGEQLVVEGLDTDRLPPLFVAYDPNAGEGTEVFHSSLRERFEEGDPEVIKGVARLAELVDLAWNYLKADEGEKIGPLMDENFDIRRRLSRLNPRHVEMIEIARLEGAHAKFAGSGGAIVGTCSMDRIAGVIEALQANELIAFAPVPAKAVAR